MQLTYKENMDMLEKAATFAYRNGRITKAKQIRLMMMRMIVKRVNELKMGSVQK